MSKQHVSIKSLSIYSETEMILAAFKNISITGSK